MDIGDFDRQRKMDENARRIIGFIEKLMGITYAVAVFVAVAIVIYAGIALVCLLCSCTSTRYVPVESVRVEYRDREVEKLVADTVHDTRLVWVKGDTVVDIRREERIRRVEIHDTCYIERTDSVQVPYPVERRLNKWEQTKQDYGGWAIVVLAVVVCVAVAWIARRFRRR